MVKQVQFRGASRSRGFSPEQVSGAAISRMREESNRVQKGMREAAAAEIANRKQVQDDVETNQKIEKAGRERNQKIQKSNLNIQVQQAAYDASTTRNQFEIDQKNAEATFKSVATLSKTATDKYVEIQKQKSDERAQQVVNEFMLNPNNDAVIKQFVGETELAVAEEQRQTELSVAEAQNASPVAVSRARALDSNARYKLDQARANYILTNLYPQQLQKAKLEAGVMDGSTTAAFVTEFQREFFEKTQILQLKPEMIRDGLSKVLQTNQSFTTAANNKEIENQQAKTLDDATTILTQNPTAFNQNIVTSFGKYVTVHGFPKAYEWFEGLATMRGPDGNYLFSEDQLKAAVLKNGKTFEQSHPGRLGKMLRARLNGENTYRSSIMTADKLSYQEAEADNLEKIAADPSQANVDYVVKEFRKRFGKVPQSILTFQKSFTHEAVAKSKQIQTYEAIPDSLLNQETVEAMCGLSPGTDCSNITQRYTAKEAKYNSKDSTFKKQSDAFKSIANGKTVYGNVAPNSNTSVFILGKIQGEYRRRVDNAVAAGRTFEEASETEAIKLQSEIKAAEKGGMWERALDGPGGTVRFPYFEPTDNEKAIRAKKDREYQEFLKNLGANPKVVITTANSIINAEEAVEIVTNLYKPGYELPEKIRRAAILTNTDPFVLVNEQIEALNKLNPEKPIPLAEPPKVYQDLTSTVNPGIRKLWDPNTGKYARKRITQHSATQLSGDASAFRNSGSMRAGSPMRTFAGSRQQNAFIQTIRTVEGTSGPQGYNTVYGGAVVPQLTQMTLGELYDAIKLGGTDAIPARLGGGKIPFKKDRYNSSASGALQLMPETLRGLVEGGGYSWNDTFSPETQNRMILGLANQGGVDIENMSPSQMSKAGNIWAGASPRYGQTNRTAADSYSIYQKLLQQ